jgi:flagellar motor switch protein FliN/FliY
MDTITMRGFAEALVAELATAVDAVCGDVTIVPAAMTAKGQGWCLTATASGGLRGLLVAWVDREGSETIARRVMGMDEQPDAAVVGDMLREMWGQALGAVSMQPAYKVVKVAMGDLAVGSFPDHGLTFDLRAGDTVIAQVAVGGSAVAAPAPAPTPAAAATPPSRPQPSAGQLETVLDIELPLVVRFARTVMSLKALSALGPGSIVDMERTPEEPVQLLVGDRVIARGEVVVVGGNYGVRVTELVGPGERAGHGGMTC